MLKIALSSDERTSLTDKILSYLNKNNYEVSCFGAIADPATDTDWPLCSSAVAKAVASKKADLGIVCCHTGTGASIAANKVKGIRAALVADPETALGARIWNHANVLALSLKNTPLDQIEPILETFIHTPIDAGEAQNDWNVEQIERVNRLDKKNSDA